MIKNVIKTAWRNILRNKSNTVIHITGLSLGMICCLFIFLWVKDEKSVDNFHSDGDHLFAVYQNITANGQSASTYTTPVYYADRRAYYSVEEAARSIPEIKGVCFYATGYELPWGHPETIQFGEKMVKLNGARASHDFFKMFSYPLIQGNASNALADIHDIAISRKMANMFFKTPEDAMGKTIRYENSLNFTITAVFEDLPGNSSFQFDFLLTWEAHKNILENASNEFQTIELLRDGASAPAVEEKLTRFAEANSAKFGGVAIKFGLQPFGEKYLRSVFVNGKPTDGRIEYVRIFSWVALFILAIACINFMNLATARSVKRAKEVGLRKVVGSGRGWLIGQFLSESMLFALFAMVVSIAVVTLLLPEFNSFTGKHISGFVTQASFWVTLLIILFFTGLLSGLYPAVFLSSLKPVRILKGAFRFTGGSVFFRKSLTVFQFVLSIFLIVSTIVISRQLNFVQHTHLGWDKDNLLYVRVEGELSKGQKYLQFKQEASSLPGVQMVDRSTETPHAMNFQIDGDIKWEGKQINDHVFFNPASVGFDFVQLMHLQIAYGRNFSRAIASDSNDAFMVNEEAVRQMGMKNPIGKWISAWRKKGHIFGVLKDYHTQSLRDPIRPVVLDVKENENFGMIMIRTRAGQMDATIDNLARIYKKINPNYPFAYQFVDQEYQSLYSSEMVISKLSVAFASLAIAISCLGLLGLVMFAAEQRVKEIGVRKVLGASARNILILFSGDFVRLIVIAFLVAAPISWYFMQHWLADFAYRVEVSWWVILGAGLVSVGIALATIAWQTIRSARANPVLSLRSE